MQYFIVDYALAAKLIKEEDLKNWIDYEDCRVLRVDNNAKLEAFNYSNRTWVEVTEELR
jgi:hypothetical protein